MVKPVGEVALTPDELAQFPDGTPDVSALLLRNQQLLEKSAGWRFPQGAPQQLYNSTLEGVPFLVTQDVKWATKPASTVNVKDDKGNVIATRTIPAQECLDMVVRLLSLDPESGKWVVGEPKHATLTGQYLLNQVRSLEANGQTGMLYGGYVWTVKRNTAYTTVGGQAPYMLALYEATPEDGTF